MAEREEDITYLEVVGMHVRERMQRAKYQLVRSSEAKEADQSKSDQFMAEMIGHITCSPDKLLLPLSPSKKQIRTIGHLALQQEKSQLSRDGSHGAMYGSLPAYSRNHIGSLILESGVKPKVSTYIAGEDNRPIEFTISDHSFGDTFGEVSYMVLPCKPSTVAELHANTYGYFSHGKYSKWEILDGALKMDIEVNLMGKEHRITKTYSHLGQFPVLGAQRTIYGIAEQAPH